MTSKITYIVEKGTDRKILEAEVDDEQSLMVVLDAIRVCCNSGSSGVVNLELDVYDLPDAETLLKSLESLKGLRPPPPPRQPGEGE